MFNYRDSEDAENTIRRVINITDFTRRLINVLIKKQMKACSFFKTPECDGCSYSTIGGRARSDVPLSIT